MKCRKCNNELIAKDRFCFHCGAEVHPLDKLLSDLTRRCLYYKRQAVSEKNDDRQKARAGLLADDLRRQIEALTGVMAASTNDTSSTDQSTD